MLNNLVVAISGGAGRIGSSFSRAIIANGGKVIIGDITEIKGNKLVQELGADNVSLYLGDLTVAENLERFIEKGLGEFGKIDAAVHCAYPTSSQWGTSFENLQPEGLKEDLFNQLGGAILFSQSFIHYFREQGCGNLVHISSIQGIAAPKFEHYEGTEMVSPIEYTAIKAGIISITKFLAKYCTDQKIRVNCISPGGIFDKQPENFLIKYRESCTSKGMLDSDDLCGTLLFLLSSHSKFVNGQNLIVDDGWSL